MIGILETTVVPLLIISTMVIMDYHRSIVETVNVEDACYTCHCASYEKGIAVNCSSRNLTEVPKNIPETSFLIDLSNNNLEFVTQDVFSSTSNLKYLYLAKNRIQELPERLLAHNTEIVEVSTRLSRSLRKNRVQKLPESLFARNSQIQNLDFTENNITMVPEALLSSLKYLRILSFSENQIHFLPEELFENTPRLEYLFLDKNLLKDIPENLFYRTRDMIILTLDNNQLVSIPEKLLAHTYQLEQLEIFTNNLTHLHGSMFEATPKMKTLLFSGGKISSLPSGLFRYTRELRVIDFVRNNLSGLPETPFRDVLLTKMLTLFGNRIQVIRNDVLSSPSLRQIYLFGNNLVNVSLDSFSTSANLEIHLYGNNVTSLSGKSDQGAHASYILYINCEHLHEIQRVNARMNCISSEYVPEIKINKTNPVEKYIAWLLRFEGFACYEDAEKQCTICKICPKGTYGNGENDCMHCPEGGFYQDQIGAMTEFFRYMKCKNCSAGTYVRYGGGTSIEDCINCPDGTNKSMHAVFRACFCNDGYARRDRLEGCYKCQKQGRICRQGFESLKPNYYWNWSFPNANLSGYNAFVHNLLDLTLWYDDNTHYNGEIPRV